MGALTTSGRLDLTYSPGEDVLTVQAAFVIQGILPNKVPVVSVGIARRSDPMQKPYFQTGPVYSPLVYSIPNPPAGTWWASVEFYFFDTQTHQLLKVVSEPPIQKSIVVQPASPSNCTHDCIAVEPRDSYIKDGKDQVLTLQAWAYGWDLSVKSVAWAFAAPPFAGNDPSYTWTGNRFRPKWVAYPNSDCDKAVLYAQANYNSRWSATGRACIGSIFSSTCFIFEDTAAVTTWVPFPNLGDQPDPQLGGQYTLALSDTGVWYVSPQTQTSLTRFLPPYRIFPDTIGTQFQRKTEVHEGWHRQQFLTGIAEDAYQVCCGSWSLWNYRGKPTDPPLSSLTAPTRDALISLVNKYVLGWQQRERDRLDANPLIEQEAYAVSDSISPRYLMQGCTKDFTH